LAAASGGGSSEFSVSTSARRIGGVAHLICDGVSFGRPITSSVGACFLGGAAGFDVVATAGEVVDFRVFGFKADEKIFSVWAKASAFSVGFLDREERGSSTWGDSSFLRGIFISTNFTQSLFYTEFNTF
jgi:hypothetical protein